MIKEVKPMMEFFSAIAKDPRISTTHIALFSAIYNLWLRNPTRISLAIKRKELMEIAKISSSATYHKTIRALHEYGYIQYKPSFKPAKSTEISLHTSKSP